MSNPSNRVRRAVRASALRRAVAGIGAVVVAALTGACADAPAAPTSLAPAAAPSLGLALGKLGRFGKSDTLAVPAVSRGLLRTTPLRAAVSASFVVKGAGGRFEVPGTGLSIQVPAGALPKDQPLTITVTALAGDLVAYEFEPHGTQFNKPLQLTQDLRATNWQRRLAATLDVGYFASRADVNLAQKTALVREALPTGLGLNGTHVEWDVSHFSGYMVSWGRR
jgi:hypothetical protein